MENGEKGAFAVDGKSMLQTGLTKREYFAGLAMQGILSAMHYPLDANRKSVSEKSIQMADELLKQLEA